MHDQQQPDTIEMTSLADQGRTVNIIYLDSREAFNTASPKIVMAKLMK